MYTQKIIFLSSLFAAILLVSADGDSHNLNIGHRVAGDGLGLVQKLEYESQQSVFNKELEFHVGEGKQITQLLAVNTDPDNIGGYVKLLGGGPGYNYAKLGFQSQQGSGIHFVVKLYNH